MGSGRDNPFLVPRSLCIWFPFAPRSDFQLRGTLGHSIRGGSMYTFSLRFPHRTPSRDRPEIEHRDLRLPCHSLLRSRRLRITASAVRRFADREGLGHPARRFKERRNPRLGSGGRHRSLCSWSHFGGSTRSSRLRLLLQHHESVDHLR